MKVTADLTIPVAIAIVIFALVNPIMEKMRKIKIPEFLSIIFILALVIFVITTIVYTTLSMINLIIGKLPYYYNRVILLDKQLSLFISRYDSNLDPNFSLLNSLNYDWYGLLMSSLTSISTKAVSIVGDVFVIILTLLFILFERASFRPKLAAVFTRESGHRFTILLGRINRQITKYLFLKIIISAATGFLFYLSAVFTGLDFALVWGVMAFILNFIPNVGSIIATAITILMAVIQFSPNWTIILYVAIINTSIEIVLGNIIDPRLQGVQLNLSPFVILMSLSLWGYIWGIPGMFLAVPITSMLQIICANIPSLRSIAVLLSGGKSYLRAAKANNKIKNYKDEDYSKDVDANEYNVVLPEGHNRIYDDSDEE
ncbi:MAG: AI-2E family transporter [Sphaerochaetaceae bacterium]|nr:AI-2E family transporter [Sphaerochaetaceae bacterium]